MSDPIFARTRHQYDSYQDFWRLVELSGFDTCYVDEIDAASDHTYIYTPNNGETMHGWPDARARIIWYQLEWETHPNDTGPLPPGVAEKWTMDKWHADQIGAQYVPIGSHAELAGYVGVNVDTGDDVYTPQNPDGFYPKQFDVAYMAYMGPPRRQNIMNAISRKGLRASPNGWGYARHDYLRYSRAMLHVHQHETVPGVAALRVALAAAYSLPYISEQVADQGIFSHTNMLFSDYAHLADFAQQWVRDNKSRMLDDYGRALHQLLCVEKPFRYWIEAAL